MTTKRDLLKLRQRYCACGAPLPTRAEGRGRQKAWCDDCARDRRNALRRRAYAANPETRMKAQKAARVRWRKRKFADFHKTPEWMENL